MAEKIRLRSSDQRQVSNESITDTLTKTFISELDKRLSKTEDTFKSELSKLEIKLATSESNLERKISNLELNLGQAIDFAVDTAKESIILAKECKNEIKQLSVEFESLKSVHKQLENKHINLEMKLEKNELYQRKCNLIFNCREQPTGQSVIETVKVIFNIMLLPDVVPDKLHYLRSEKQIIVRFKTLSDRDIVWSKRSNLKQSGFYVCEDLPSKLQKQRNILYSICKSARSFDEFKDVSLQTNALFINGTKYSFDTLDTLPEKLKPLTLSERKSDDVLCFGGILSRFHPLSNFCASDFVFKKNTYSSSEQALQHQKCLYFGDLHHARLIMNSNDPAEQKQCGRHIYKFNQTQWSSIRDNLLKDILLAKFNQNEELKKYLLSTGTRKLAEASAKDNVYGIARSINFGNILDSTKWDGENKLGKCLIEVRDLINK